MPSEKRPKTKPYKYTKNGRTVTIDPNEIREREGTVGLDGKRRIPMYHDPKEQSSQFAQSSWYHKNGYVKDTENSSEYCTVWMIDDTIYRDREKKLHSDTLSKRKTQTRDNQRELAQFGIAAEMEELDAMSPGDFESTFNS